MAEYRIIFARSARKELEGLPQTTVDRVVARLERIALEPRPMGVQKIRGATDLWRVRVGDYRVVYAINDAQQVVDVRVVRHRKDVYR